MMPYATLIRGDWGKNMTKTRAIPYLLTALLTQGTLVSPVSAADVAPAKAQTAKAAEPETGPFDLRLQYAGEVWQNNGGIKNGTDYISSLDASLGINLQKLAGLQGAKLYFEGFYVGGKSLDTGYTGAIAAPSPLDAFDSMQTAKLYQAFYEQTFGNLDVLVGKFDVQQQFATTRPMDVFGNRAHGMNVALAVEGVKSGSNAASIYPGTAVGTRVKYQLNDQWTIKFGVLDGMADNPNAPHRTDVLINSRYGALGVAEIDYTPIARTKLMAGIFGSTGKFQKLYQFDPGFTRHEAYGNIGGYVGGATRLYTIAGSRGVDAFFNAGVSDPSVNIFDRSFDAGVTITGLLDARPSDKLGFAVALTGASRDFRKLVALGGGNEPKVETDFELTYRASINDWLVVQPDIDYIMHPAIGAIKKEAFVFGLHFEVSKLFNF